MPKTDSGRDRPEAEVQIWGRQPSPRSQFFSAPAALVETLLDAERIEEAKDLLDERQEIGELALSRCRFNLMGYQAELAMASIRDADGLGDRLQRLARVRRARCLILAERPQAVTEMKEALSAVELAGDPPLMIAEARLYLGLGLMRAGQHNAILPTIAHVPAQELGVDLAILRQTLMGFAARENAAGAVEILENILATPGAHQLGLSLPRFVLSPFLAYVGRVDDARQQLELAVKTAHQFEAPALEAQARVRRGMVELIAGKHETAVAQLRMAIAVACKWQPETTSRAHRYLAAALERMGRPDQADSEMGLALELLDSNGTPGQQAELHAAYAQMLVARGEHEHARRELRRSVELRSEDVGVSSAPDGGEISLF